MIKLKKVTVEQIHAEFDSAQERILEEANRIIGTNVPEKSDLERKSDLLIELGFVRSELVEKARTEKNNRTKIMDEIYLTTVIANSITEFKVKYPNEKFITINELNRICNKYNLIHAPVGNYRKDIPEKNLIEIKNCKKLSDIDEAKPFYTFKFIFFNYVPKEVRNWFKTFTYNKQVDSNTNYDSEFRKICPIKYDGDHLYKSLITIRVDRSGLFIAAPKSHFNLNNLKKMTKFGMFNVTVTQNDPVVFQYCKNDIVRIISKWGTKDDQSYLDQTLINEKLN